MGQTKTKLQTFAEKAFNRKQLITKGIILSCAIVLVLSLCLSFYFWLHDKEDGTVIGQNPFWYIKIVWNSGVGWSALSNNPAAVYAIQSIMFVLLLSVFVLVVRDRWSASFVAIAMLGGLFNLLQRACESGMHAGCVLDYFRFGFWESFPTFNWPDMFVVVGIFGFIISFIVYSIRKAIKEEKEEKAKNNAQAEQ